MFEISSIRVGFGLGSNLGDRRRAIAEAFTFLKTCGLNFQQSSLYESDPVDCPAGSPPFLNAAAELSYTGDLLELLHRCQEFERRQGRPEIRGKNTPRSVDIDLLYGDEMIIEHPQLTLPHPSMHLRAFVLQPLMEICPERVFPGGNRRMCDLWHDLVRHGENQLCRKIV